MKHSNAARKGKVYLSHAQKADARLMLIFISLTRRQSLALPRWLPLNALVLK